jgi:hypothetical protein
MIKLSRRSALTGAVIAGLGLGGIAKAQGTKIDLWDNATGPHLRGGVIPQRRVYPDIDGSEFLGPGPVGVPISDQALNTFAELGGNLVILSLPGICREAPPYGFDPDIEAYLDDIVMRCERAGLFVVIGFRSGPGRSEFTFHREDGDSWFPASMIDEHMWASFEAHDAWERMWRRIALQYKHRSNVAGYLLMVEPNANQATRDIFGNDLDEWDADKLRDLVRGTPGDWPVLANRLAVAIREMDAETPILMSPDGYANVAFLSNLDLNVVPNIVLCVHDYGPRHYTHQGRGDNVSFDPADAVFQPPNSTHWMMGELGAARWAPDVDQYLERRIGSLEQAGAGWAYFRLDSGWLNYEAQENMFNAGYGSNPEADIPDPNSSSMNMLRRYWHRNILKPAMSLRR